MIDKSRFDKSKYKFIYNCSWANYLILQGASCLGTGVSQSTGKYFWCFNYDEVQPIYAMVEKRKKAKEVAE